LQLFTIEGSHPFFLLHWTMFFFSSLSSLFLLLAASSSRSNIFTKATTLITFDVDGTLIHGTGQASNEGAHAQAFQHALQHVLGDKQTPIPGVGEALDRRLYHGSTDGLILLRYARAALQVEPTDSFPQLDTMMQVMFDYIQELDNTAVSQHLAPLPGVLENLQKLAKCKDQVKCALVTGNVEGIARRKMDAVGILDTGALHPPCQTQKEWPGTQHLAFLGGFGSDYCSGNIDDLARNHLDRCRTTMQEPMFFRKSIETSGPCGRCSRRCLGGQGLERAKSRLLRRYGGCGDGILHCGRIDRASRISSAWQVGTSGIGTRHERSRLFESLWYRRI